MNRRLVTVVNVRSPMQGRHWFSPIKLDSKEKKTSLHSTITKKKKKKGTSGEERTLGIGLPIFPLSPFFWVTTLQTGRCVPVETETFNDGEDSWLREVVLLLFQTVVDCRGTGNYQHFLLQRDCRLSRLINKVPPGDQFITISLGRGRGSGKENI